MTADEIATSLALARGKLKSPPPPRASAARVLAAAALAAVSALSLAAAVILGPGYEAKDAGQPTIFGER